ncbi:MAG TPA: GPW/gp25 family protein [Polyangia bacterium]|nr:GPW/gp25 family protein [Polyangia bacterium]
MAIITDPTGDLGTDITLVSDLAPVWGVSAGTDNLINAILRRLTTPRGRLFYDPDYGYDVVSQLNASLGPTDMARIQAAITAELRKDPRIQSMTVTLSVPGGV